MKKNLLSLPKIFFTIFLSGLLFCVLTQSVFAISASPSNLNLNLNPGDEYNFNVEVSNNEISTISITAVDFYYNQYDAQVFITDGSTLPTGFTNWTELETNEVTVEPNETVAIPVSIKVPADAAPGAYYSAFMVSPLINPDNVSQFAIQGRIALTSFINVGGEGLTNAVEIKSFDFDKEGAQQGNYQFTFKLENTGEGLVNVYGNIMVFDSEGNQIKGLQTIYENINGTQVVTGIEDSIRFSRSNSALLPGRSSNITVAWNNPSIEEGNYVAKSTIFYGHTNQEVTAETKFSVTKGLEIIDLTVSDYQYSTPVSFSGKIKNFGTSASEVDAKIFIKSLFGQDIAILPITDGYQSIHGSDTLEFTNIVWEDALLSGPYTAVVETKLGKNGVVIEESISLFILHWWQVLIALAVIAIAIFITIKLTKSYTHLKKQVNKLQKKKV